MLVFSQGGVHSHSRYLLLSQQARKLQNLELCHQVGKSMQRAFTENQEQQTCYWGTVVPEEILQEDMRKAERKNIGNKHKNDQRGVLDINSKPEGH